MDAIALENVSKGYGGKDVLRGLCCRFPLGRTACVMGPSGCGKTTLLNLLLGLERPDSGRITGLEGLRKSAIFQEDRLVETAGAVANLRLVNPRLTRQRAEGLLRALGLGDSLGQPVGAFSGGMKRRVAILRALHAEYDVLFADEPFKGFDAATKQLVMEYFRDAAQGKTVVLVTHEEAERDFFGGPVVLLENVREN